jgi:hypothetical protein
MTLERRVGFTYTVLDPVDRDVIGCVYLYPSPLDGVDVRARSSPSHAPSESISVIAHGSTAEHRRWAPVLGSEGLNTGAGPTCLKALRT